MNLSRRSAIALAATVLALFAPPLAITQSANAAEFATRSNEMGGVRIVVTPKAVAAKSDWEFAVTMDTHTKPLDDDLTKTAVLVDDGGRKYNPLSWQGDKPGGHHRKGVLRFPAPSEQVKSFELQIQGSGGENKRVFQWTMK
jgi:hypothetical protein